MVFDIKSASKKHFSVWLLLKYKKLLLPIIIGSLLIGIGLIIFSQPRYYGGYQEHPEIYISDAGSTALWVRDESNGYQYYELEIKIKVSNPTEYHVKELKVYCSISYPNGTHIFGYNWQRTVGNLVAGDNAIVSFRIQTPKEPIPIGPLILPPTSYIVHITSSGYSMEDLPVDTSWEAQIREDIPISYEER
jgi:hypothetical protein